MIKRISLTLALLFTIVGAGFLFVSSAFCIGSKAASVRHEGTYGKVSNLPKWWVDLNREHGAYITDGRITLESGRWIEW
jgi:hypothetical protein